MNKFRFIYVSQDGLNFVACPPQDFPGLGGIVIDEPTSDFPACRIKATDHFATLKMTVDVYYAYR